MKKGFKKIFSILLVLTMLISTGVMSNAHEVDRKIIRIGHNQSEQHPTHIALKAFKKYVESKLGEKYDIEIYPSELLGSQMDMVQLTQTGAINYCVASNAILETFSKDYEIFNLPFLFASEESYHHVMDDKAITGSIFNSTKRAGFKGVTWIDAGTRNFYTVNKPINSPKDLKGLKIRVQQSPTNIKMMSLLGGSATPMGFGEVYTALQSHIIDGAENNEMALTSKGHGDVCKYYSYDMHQMVPDILIGNSKFIQKMPAKDRKVFEEGYKIINKVERAEWKKAIKAAKNKAEKDMKVKFLYPDRVPFQKACEPLHNLVISKNSRLKKIYNQIEKYNKKYPAKKEVK